MTDLSKVSVDDLLDELSNRSKEIAERGAVHPSHIQSLKDLVEIFAASAKHVVSNKHGLDEQLTEAVYNRVSLYNIHRSWVYGVHSKNIRNITPSRLASAYQLSVLPNYMVIASYITYTAHGYVEWTNATDTHTMKSLYTMIVPGYSYPYNVAAVKITNDSHSGLTEEKEYRSLIRSDILDIINMYKEHGFNNSIDFNDFITAIISQTDQDDLSDQKPINISKKDVKEAVKKVREKRLREADASDDLNYKHKIRDKYRLPIKARR